jgi:ferredoxin-NADP reductase
MEEHIVRIESIHPVTHNVKQFRISKPQGYTFEPGQATEVSINKPGWKEKRNPFTFTSLNAWPWLEFTIKIYPERQGVTNELNKLNTGDELIIHDVWGAIEYKGEGYFIAGGAGITPFISILRQLNSENGLRSNQLFFSNRTQGDIILHQELDAMLGANAHYILTNEENSPFEYGHIDKHYLVNHVTDFTKRFYVCGPDKMVADLAQALSELGAGSEQVVFEK